MLIGLTGLIGAGKSTAGRILESLGAAVIDADDIGREVIDHSPEVRKGLADAFGADVLFGDGTLDRKKVAERAFVNEHTRRLLNDVVHPSLLRDLHQQMHWLTRHHPVVVVDAALLIEWELDKKMDYTIVVEAAEELRHDRLAARGISPSDARAIERLQSSPDEFRARADFVVVNDGHTDHLESKLRDIWRAITRPDRGDSDEQPDTAAR